jgi:hypothetical protein
MRNPVLGFIVVALFVLAALVAEAGYTFYLQQQFDNHWCQLATDEISAPAPSSLRGHIIVRDWQVLSSELGCNQ